MTGKLRLSSALYGKGRRALYAFALVALAVSHGCQSRAVRDETQERGIIIINAPAAGEVRRVLVREGMVIDKGTPIVEIIVRTEAQSLPQVKGEDPQARAGRNLQASQVGIEAARAEVVRTEVEVQRLTPLVASGDAPQSQLDGARADYERAQQNFRRAQDAARDAQAGLVAARQQSMNSAQTVVTPSEQIVTADATSSGTVSVVSAKVGERVSMGQPLATLRAAP
jgi:multidrug efflux pump subunit AcrA (membrane-fusion protein)